MNRTVTVRARLHTEERAALAKLTALRRRENDSRPWTDADTIREAIEALCIKRHVGWPAPGETA